jgi:excisionase family DNA binding protein
MPNNEQLVLTAEEVAELLCISRAHVFRLQSSGHLPRPIRLGRAVRWPRAVLEAWLEAGAPPRDRWEEMNGSSARRAQR